MDRRSFISQSIGGAIAASFFNELDFISDEERFWKKIKKSFPISNSKILNLNNGSAGLMPIVVQQYLINAIKLMNKNPPYEQKRMWDDVLIEIKIRLAKLLSVDHSELAITRNTTESLQLVLNGINVEKNSEIVGATSDYPYAVNGLQKLANRCQAQFNEIELTPNKGINHIIDAYSQSINANTSLVFITSITHREGYLMPVKKIAQIAKAHGATVVVDAAHSIGLHQHNVKEWNCDYYCTSLHKWMSAPHGTGLIYVNKNSLVKISGRSGAPLLKEDDMLKFDYSGTRPFYTEVGILSALDYLEKIGLERKKERLISLNKYWSESLNQISGINVDSMENKIAINTFRSTKMNASKMANELNKKNIHVKTVKAIGRPGEIRISPNIYHDFNDMDRFINTVKKLVK